tara:strand:+ start:1890 stop:3134 length:1245 start_codon:yes stop_codon:yes gene_type:complete
LRTKHKQFRPHWTTDLQSLITQLRQFPKHIQKHCLDLAVRSANSGNEIVFDENKKGATIETPRSSRIRTIDDLINHCEIDLDVWEIERYVVNKWEVGSNVEGTIIVEPLFQIKAWLKKNTDILNIKKLRDELINEVQTFSPKYPKLEYKKIDNGHLLEINIFDLHFGKLCWGLETGDNYDTKIASKRFLTAIHAIIKRSEGYDIKRIVFPVGNDFFNSDTRLNQTSAGTPQDEDVRWQKTFKAGRELLIAGIDMLSKIAPVDVVIVQGNHDWERSFYVGDVLSCWYFNNPNVEVNNQPTPRKHYKFGNCLISYTHGNNEKIIDLPLLVASEVPKLWASTQFREIHIGHLHHKKEIKFMATQEHKGIVVRFMRSLSGTDAWHNFKGYKGAIQACEAFIWDENEGLICQFSHNLIK